MRSQVQHVRTSESDHEMPAPKLKRQAAGVSGVYLARCFRLVETRWGKRLLEADLETRSRGFGAVGHGAGL